MEDPTKPQDKIELVSYIKRLNLGNPKKLEERAEEIMDNVKGVMQHYLERPDTDPIKVYYAPILRDLETAFEKKDFEKTFPLILDSLKISIISEGMRDNFA